MGPKTKTTNTNPDLPREVTVPRTDVSREAVSAALSAAANPFVPDYAPDDIERRMAANDLRIQELGRQVAELLERRVALPFVAFRADADTLRMALVIEKPVGDVAKLFVFGYGKHGFAIVSNVHEGDGVGEFQRR